MNDIEKKEEKVLHFIWYEPNLFNSRNTEKRTPLMFCYNKYICNSTDNKKRNVGQNTKTRKKGQTSQEVL